VKLNKIKKLIKKKKEFCYEIHNGQMWIGVQGAMYLLSDIEIIEPESLLKLMGYEQDKIEELLITTNERQAEDERSNDDKTFIDELPLEKKLFTLIYIGGPKGTVITMPQEKKSNDTIIAVDLEKLAAVEDEEPYDMYARGNSVAIKRGKQLKALLNAEDIYGPQYEGFHNAVSLINDSVQKYNTYGVHHD
jgi:hypothetical protein